MLCTGPTTSWLDRACHELPFRHSCAAPAGLDLIKRSLGTTGAPESVNDTGIRRAIWITLGSHFRRPVRTSATRTHVGHSVGERVPDDHSGHRVLGAVELRRQGSAPANLPATAGIAEGGYAPIHPQATTRASASARPERANARRRRQPCCPVRSTMVGLWLARRRRACDRPASRIRTTPDRLHRSAPGGGDGMAAATAAAVAQGLRLLPLGNFARSQRPPARSPKRTRSHD